MDEKSREKLRNQIKKNLDDFVFDANTFAGFEKAFDDNMVREFGMKLQIIDGKVKILRNSDKSEKQRKTNILFLIEKSIEYHRQRGIEFPNVLFYLYVCDAYAYKHQKLPFFIMAKPKNKTGILIPDDTFACHPIHQKCYDWNNVKKECEKVVYEKENYLFFAGANTDRNRQNIRSGLAELELDKTSDLPLKILLKQPRLSLCDFKKYKYLLNLPGNQPWSYRFKYLFLMRSVVINVNVFQQYTEKDGWNEQWVNFFDTIFEKDVDYVNIDFRWKENKEDFNRQSFKSLVSDLQTTYDTFNSDHDKYEKMAQSGYEKVNMITNDVVSEFIYELFVEYSKRCDFSK